MTMLCARSSPARWAHTTPRPPTATRVAKCRKSHINQMVRCLPQQQQAKQQQQQLHNRLVLDRWATARRVDPLSKRPN